MRVFLLAALAATCLTGQALAAPSQDVTQIPSCTKSLGTISVVNGDQQGWQAMQLAPPQKLIRYFVQESGCFKLVDRGAGMDAAKMERELASGGELQRGSNVGKGQIKAADYVLVAEVSAQNDNAGGGALGGALGGLVGGRLGAIAGGVNFKKQTAQGILSLTNVRTSEVDIVAKGEAKKTNIGFGAGGFVGFGGAVGGGYDNTEVGRVVTQAFLNAYASLVSQLGGVPATPSAPKKAYAVASAAQLWKYPTGGGSKVRDLPAGALVYPTGTKEGMYWEVEDENENTGWVKNDQLKPAK
ncbi:MAG: CsgG/HfaB family protein [Hyphomonadaceae bacterium]